MKRLAIMSDLLTRSLATSSDGEQVASKWPSRGDLFFCQLASVVFPVTDYRHVVTTPMLLFLARTITQCPLSSPRDILSGIFTCHLVLGFTQQSQRYCPEILPFLCSLLQYTTTQSGAAPRYEGVQGALQLTKAAAKLSPEAVGLSEVGCVGGHKEGEALPEQVHTKSAVLNAYIYQERSTECVHIHIMHTHTHRAYTYT